MGGLALRDIFVRGIENPAVHLKLLGSGLIKLFKLPAKRVFGTKAQFQCHNLWAFSALKLAPCDYHSLQIHPLLGSQPDVTNKHGMQIPVAAAQRTTHFRHAIPLTQGEPLKAKTQARERLDDTP